MTSRRSMKQPLSFNGLATTMPELLTHMYVECKVFLSRFCVNSFETYMESTVWAACFSFSRRYRYAMNKTVIEVQVRAVLPTSGGCAVFIGNNEKVFIIYVDQTVGSAITMFTRQITKERPLTHDLMGHLMTALGAKVERVIINDLKNATYYAR